MEKLYKKIYKWRFWPEMYMDCKCAHNRKVYVDWLIDDFFASEQHIYMIKSSFAEWITHKSLLYWPRLLKVHINLQHQNEVTILRGNLRCSPILSISMQNWEDILLIGAHGNNIHEYEMSSSLLQLWPQSQQIIIKTKMCQQIYFRIWQTNLQCQHRRHQQNFLDK